MTRKGRKKIKKKKKSLGNGLGSNGWSLNSENVLCSCILLLTLEVNRLGDWFSWIKIFCLSFNPWNKKSNPSLTKTLKLRGVLWKSSRELH